MIVLDACVLIAHFNSKDSLHYEAGQLLTEIVDQGQSLAASPLTLAEILVGPARAGNIALAQAALKQLQVNAVPFDEDMPIQLAVLRAETNLKLPDCCVLLAAQQTHGTIATFDERLAINARKLGLAVKTKSL